MVMPDSAPPPVREMRPAPVSQLRRAARGLVAARGYGRAAGGSAQHRQGAVVSVGHVDRAVGLVHGDPAVCVTGALYLADPVPTVTVGGFPRQPEVVMALQVAPLITDTTSAPFGAIVAA
jgi:hypothetical protein